MSSLDLETEPVVNTQELIEDDTKSRRGGKKAQFTHCDICEAELGEDEINMGAANHRDCWKKWVEEKRKRDPIDAEAMENE